MQKRLGRPIPAPMLPKVYYLTSPRRGSALSEKGIRNIADGLDIAFRRVTRAVVADER